MRNYCLYASNVFLFIPTTPSQHLPPSFFARPAEVVAPDLSGCLMVKLETLEAIK